MAKPRKYRIRVVTREPEKADRVVYLPPEPTRHIEVDPGAPLPLGATRVEDDVNFAVFSRNATSVSLVIFEPGEEDPVETIPLDPGTNRTGDVWHCRLRDLPLDFEYGYRVGGPNAGPGRSHRFDDGVVLLDPYARALTGAEKWCEPPHYPRHRSCLVNESFDWLGDRPPNRHLADSVIYELHVRGFTRDPRSGVQHPGTFAGLVEKIPYLVDLGVTAVELLPVTEFEELDNRRVDPRTGKRLLNYWGYNPLGFFAVKSSYASRPARGGQLREFKSMVRALHDAGIEVILDVVFNHTGEGDEEGTTYSFRGLDNSIYYLIDHKTDEYRNYTGCGNTVNCNHPVVQDLIVDSLRYWVTEMHVDGFRFDLASVLARGTDSSVLPSPPVLERIAADPVLAGRKLIAEAWDASGLYQVGSFPHWGRWAEWNDHFRDDVRRLLRGDAGMIAALATRLAGSSDLYQRSRRAPFHGVNFVTSHDGFTLHDLVSYEERRNEANGEDNEDGHAVNLSWNCGVEGETTSEEVLVLRRRQVRNFATLLLLSQGVPMIVAGDEMGRTQRGNNNAYCQDNETSWIDWSLLERNRDLFRFFKLLIAFRKRQPALRRRGFFRDGNDDEVVWHGTRLEHPDWSRTSRELSMHLRGGADADDILLMVNVRDEARSFELPQCPGTKRWHRFIDTLREPPDEIHGVTDLPRLSDATTYTVGPRTVVVLIGR